MKELKQALERVLTLPRGTSGRIILEREDEEALKRVLKAIGPVNGTEQAATEPTALAVALAGLDDMLEYGGSDPLTASQRQAITGVRAEVLRLQQEVATLTAKLEDAQFDRYLTEREVKIGNALLAAGRKAVAWLGHSNCCNLPDDGEKGSMRADMNKLRELLFKLPRLGEAGMLEASLLSFPSGYTLMPIDPDEEMLLALALVTHWVPDNDEGECGERDAAYEGYALALSCAPRPPVPSNPGRPLTVNEALRRALDDLRSLSPKKLREELDKHANGELALALRDARDFLTDFIPEEPSGNT